MTENIYELLTNFIKRNKDSTMCRSEWLYPKELEVYVRLGSYMIEGKLEKCFVIATIQIYNEYRGLGYFQNLVKTMEELKPTKFIYVQSVLDSNERMNLILQRNGFQYADNYASISRNYYKRYP